MPLTFLLQRNLAGYSPWGWQRVRQDLALSTIIFRTVVGRTKHQWLLVCGLWFNIFLSHLAVCSTGAHAPGSALLTTVSGFNKWKNKNRKWTHPPSRTPGSERIHWHGDGTLSLASFSIAHWKWPHVPLSPTPGWPLQASLPSALKSYPGHMGSGGGGALCDVTKGPALPGPQSPGASADQRTRSHLVSAHDALCNMVIFLAYVYLVCLCLCVLCSERWSRRTAEDGAQWKALPRSAESTRVCPRLVWEQVALAVNLPHVFGDPEVSWRRWQKYRGHSSWPSGLFIWLSRKKEDKAFPLQRVYVRCLNPVRDVTDEPYVQGEEYETHCGNRWSMPMSQYRGSWWRTE